MCVMKKSTYIFILLSSILFLYCSKEEENTKPPSNQNLLYSNIVFSQQNDILIHFIEMDFVSPSIGYLLNNEEVFKTTDQGDNWIPFYEISNTDVDLHYLDFYSKDLGIIGGSQGYNSFVLLTENGGVSWDTIYFESWTSNRLVEVVWINENDLIGIGEQHFLKSTDSGQSWHTTFSDPLSLSQKFCVDFVDESNGFVFGDGYTYMTSDKGESYISLPSAKKVSPVYIDFIDSKKGMVGVYEGVEITKDGGMTWSNALLNDTSFVTYLYKPFYLNKSIIYSLAFGNDGANGIAKSVDGGSTFDVIQEKWKAGNKYYRFIGPLFMIDENVGFIMAHENVSKDKLETIESSNFVILKTNTGWQ